LIEVVIWTGFGGVDGEVFTRAVYEFTRKYNQDNNVSIEAKVINRDFMANYRELLTMSYEDPYFPDAFITHAYKVDEYASKTEPLPENASFWKNLDKDLLQTSYHGFEVRPYALPIDVHSAVLYFKKSVLEKEGISVREVKEGLAWSRFISILKILKERGYEPFAFLWEFPVVSSYYIQSSFKKGIDPEDYSSGALAEALSLMNELSQYSVGPKYGDPYAQLSKGKPVFAIEGMWNKKWIVESLGYDVAPLPVVDGLNEKYCWAASHVFAVSRRVEMGDPQESAQKKKFLYALAGYLVSENFQEKWAKLGFVPVNKKVRMMFLRKDPYHSSFSQSRFYVFPFRESMKDVWGVFETSLMRTLAGEPSEVSARYIDILKKSP